MSLHRFDHAAAKAYFIGLDPGERSSRAVAEKYSVTEKTIKKWRKIDKWDDAAAKRDRELAAKLERQEFQSREQRALQDIRIRARAAERVEKRLEHADTSDDWVRQVLQDADKRVRLNEGEATDHVAVAQVQAGFREMVDAAYQLAFEVGGEELQRVFRARLPGLVSERLALIGGDGGA